MGTGEGCAFFRNNDIRQISLPDIPKCWICPHPTKYTDMLDCPQDARGRFRRVFHWDSSDRISDRLRRFPRLLRPGMLPVWPGLCLSRAFQLPNRCLTRQQGWDLPLQAPQPDDNMHPGWKAGCGRRFRTRRRPGGQ